ncbi:MAG: hypothetical protein KY391_07295 [Actinobacteria bacterium]|nr:hypothetical protein [Actinomycetota bacterium]
MQRTRQRLRMFCSVAIVVGACTSASPPTTRTTPTPGASPNSRRSATTRAEPTQRRLDASVIYRNFCRRHESPARPLVAAYDGNDVVLTSTDGVVVARIPGRPPVRWSSSGGLVAVGPEGELWTNEGRPYEAPETHLALVDEREDAWAWSPSGDCALVLKDGLLSAFHTGAGANSVILIEEGVESFWWGPGSEVAMVIKNGARRELWSADLRRGDMTRLIRFPKKICCVKLAGWDPGGKRVLYWAGPRKSGMQDGWELHSVDQRGRTRAWGTTLPRPDTIARCGDDLVGLIGGDRTGRGNRLAVLEPNERPDAFTSAGTFTGISCSNDGRYVVATTDQGLELFSVGGGRVTALTDDPGVTDVFPQWGPARSGVLFVRQSGGTRQLWFNPEGGRARFMMELGDSRDMPAELLFDWTATPPGGGPLEMP